MSVEIFMKIDTFLIYMDGVKLIVDVYICLDGELCWETFWRDLVAEVETGAYVTTGHTKFVTLAEACSGGHFVS